MQSKDSEGRQGPCTCTKDGFAVLPPELRPQPRKKSSLRKVKCPGCGLVYWTNRDGDLCMDCGKEKDEQAP